VCQRYRKPPRRGCCPDRPDPVATEADAGRPVLVTGVHRAGTTWVGRVIDLSPDVGYINEPFNPTHELGICACRFPYWYQYVHPGNEHLFKPALSATLSFRYRHAVQLRHIRSVEGVRRLLVDGGNFLRYRIRGARPLLKDPIAAMSASWLSTTFGAQVIVIVRHPAAIAHSLRRLDWTHPFGDFLHQSDLMADHLREFEHEIRQMADEEYDIVDQASLLWRIVYSVLLKYKTAHPDWLFLRHEDLARDPVGGFTRVFQWLDLEYSDKIQRGVRWYSSGSPYAEGTTEAHAIRRDSAMTRHNWRKTLSPDDVMRLRTAVEPLSGRFYDDSDW
jgi:hypothetical protein